ncbi:MAG: hypothetical protein GF309_15620 [Candidatus Lokiarchaeota archaeon]|nr:hypothetical protein [Candidatus Lokiarchaeota archaeon]
MPGNRAKELSDMDGGQKKGIIVVLILAAAVGVGTFMLFVPRMHEHYEAQHDDESSFIISVGGDDMTINISFVNDSSLSYSIDVEKYPDTSGYSFEVMHGGSRVEFGADRLKQITVVFGTALPYTFGIAGKNMTAHVTYDNGAIIHTAFSGHIKYEFDSAQVVSDFYEEHITLTARYFSSSRHGKTDRSELVEGDQRVWVVPIADHLPRLSLNPHTRSYPQYAVADGIHRLNVAKSLGCRAAMAFVTESVKGKQTRHYLRSVPLDEIDLPAPWSSSRLGHVHSWGSTEAFQTAVMRVGMGNIPLTGRPVLEDIPQYLQELHIDDCWREGFPHDLNRDDGLILVTRIVTVPVEPKPLDDLISEAIVEALQRR